jgi:hypothetical protein
MTVEWPGNPARMSDRAAFPKRALLSRPEIQA